MGINPLLESLNLPVIPLRYPLVTVLQTEPVPPLLRPVLGVANADMAGRQQVDGRLRVTGGAEEASATWRERVTERDDGEGLKPHVRPGAANVDRVIDTVSAVFPALKEARIANVWGGLLDLTPDALPVLDRVPSVSGLVIAAGFSGHGFGIGPVTGEIVRDLILDRAIPFDLTPFRFDRWTDPETDPTPLTLHG